MKEYFTYKLFQNITLYDVSFSTQINSNHRDRRAKNMHTIWKGSISFGLVNIPIKLHAATEDKDVKLRTLHKECHSPIKYEKVCPCL